MRKKVGRRDSNSNIKESIKANEEKWGKTNIQAGWTLIPNVLLKNQARLGLNAMDMNIILQIAQYWWEPENHPFPSKQKLASCIGVTSRTIQKRIAGLEKAGFIERIERREETGSRSNIYKLSPLKELLEPYSKEIIEIKNQREKEDKKRSSSRTRPTDKKKMEGSYD